jgi:hypothetical protein
MKIADDGFIVIRAGRACFECARAPQRIHIFIVIALRGTCLEDVFSHECGKTVYPSVK